MGILNVGRLLASASALFSPLSLFSAGEVGAWYDPSDFTTMFQDSAGTTPVTAVEQPVGLILDKSKGLAIGAELVTNGDFSSGTTGWTLAQPGTSTVTVSAGVINLQGGATEFPSAAQTILTANTWYAVTFTKVSGATADQQDLQVRVGDTFLNCGLLAAGTYTRYGVSGTSTSFTIIKRGAATSAVQIDNVSVKSLAGNHASQATTTSRPVLSARKNLLVNTETLATQSVTVRAIEHVLSFWGTGTITLTGTSTSGPLIGTGANDRVSLTFTPTAGTLTLTVSGTVSKAQLEETREGA